jgi:hypothetical protein
MVKPEWFSSAQMQALNPAFVMILIPFKSCRYLRTSFAAAITRTAKLQPPHYRKQMVSVVLVLNSSFALVSTRRVRTSDNSERNRHVLKSSISASRRTVASFESTPSSPLERRILQTRRQTSDQRREKRANL